MFELSVNTKKELSYAENSLLNSLILLQNMGKNVLEVPESRLFEVFERVNQFDLDYLKWVLRMLRSS